MSEPVHSRINELMALHEFMADANIKSGSHTAETIMNYWTEQNMPYTKQYDDKSLRAFFTLGKDFPVTPDTLHTRKGDLTDWIAELAHAIQYNAPKEVRDSTYEEAKWQKQLYGDEYRYGYEDFGEANKYFPTTRPRKITDPEVLKKKGRELSEELGMDVKPSSVTVLDMVHELYKEGTGQKVPVEFEAHSIIQPLIEQSIIEARKKDYDKENPMESKIIDILKGYLKD